MNSLLTQLADARRHGSPYGIPSICSAHPLVIRAAVRRAARDAQPVLIEATCNQVNQFGGYTGMTPERFVEFVGDIARSEGLNPSSVLFGGDHLGPNPWRGEFAEEAMAKAEAMVTAYVRAGFSKIHLDTSMGCRGEPIALDDHATAERAVRLAKAAEEAAEAAGSRLPLYVIGTEVPVPGGANHAIDALEPTKASAARRTIEVHRRTFERAGLKSAFERVIAVVVQPGVEFGSENVVHYARGKAGELTELLREEPSLIYEAHSTDYQSRSALSALVQDGFPILKVGPGLTFALREALFGLDLIASELSPDYPPRQLAETMERVMIAESGDWHHHYEGSEIRKRVQRRYSFSDRIRYYWGKPEAGAAVALLLRSLEGVVIPEPLMRQFLPTAPAELEVAGNPTGILVEAIDRVLADYAAACTGNVAEVQECG